MFERTPTDPNLLSDEAAFSRHAERLCVAVSRCSNLCHAVAAFCARPEEGFRYALERAGGHSMERVWVPLPGTQRGGPRAPNPEQLLDCVAPERVTTSDSSAFTLERCAGQREGPVTHLFVLGLQDCAGLARAIARCGASLECVVLCESKVSCSVLTALRGTAASLKAVHFHQCLATDCQDARDAARHDGAWAALLQNCTDLRWLEVSYQPHSFLPFNANAWAALPPTLLVLGYDCALEQHSSSSAGIETHSLHALQDQIRAAHKRLTNLQHLFVLPDRDAVSRATLGHNNTLKLRHPTLSEQRPDPTVDHYQAANSRW